MCLSKYKSESIIECSRCRTGICKICFLDYLNYCENDFVYPGCVASKCNGCFLFREVANMLTNENICKYYSIIVNVTLRSETLDTPQHGVDELHTKKKLIEKFIEGRIHFLEKEVGKGIMVVINSTYKDELYKIKRRHTKSLNNFKNKKDNTTLGVPCIRLLCKGLLRSYRNNLRCMLCKTKVCVKCEKERLIKHKCNIGDIKSVKAMNKIVECPQCKVKIVKYTGCEHITCISCGQSLYCDEDNNNKVYLTESRVLSKKYDLSSDTNTLAYLRLFEKSEPRIPNQKEIIRISDYIRKRREVEVIESKSDCIRLCLSIERYKSDKDKYRKYINLSDKVEKALKNKDYETTQKLMFDSI